MTHPRPPSLTTPPAGCADWLAELKTRIYNAQQRAALAVNRELVLLYWQIGRDILGRQSQQGWGAKMVDRLAHDLRTAFPDMQGFSPRNLKYMRAFAQAWPDAGFVQQGAARLPWFHLCMPVGLAKFPLIKALPADLEISLPTIAKIEQALGDGSSSAVPDSVR